MGDPPAFEVAIRTYNDPLLPRAVASAAAVPGVRRIVIVDDGSREAVDVSTLDASTVSRSAVPVDIVRQENAGAPAARDRAIAETRSEWVVLLDSDDELLPAVAEAVAMAASGDAVGAACARTFVRADGAIDREVVPPESWVAGGLPCQQAVFDHRYPIFSPSGYVVRRDAGMEAGRRCDRSINLGEDLLFSYHLRGIGPVAVFGEATARYTVHASSAGNMTGRRVIEANIDDLMRLHDACYHPDGDAEWHGLMLRWVERYARYGRSESTWRRLAGLFRSRGWALPIGQRIRFLSRNAQRAVRIRRTS